MTDAPTIIIIPPVVVHAIHLLVIMFLVTAVLNGWCAFETWRLRRLKKLLGEEDGRL